VTTTQNTVPAERLKLRCKGTNSAGQPCRSPVVGDDGWCPAHRPGADMRERGRRGGKASAKARERTDEHMRARLRRRVDRDFDRVYAAMMAGVESDDPSIAFRAASQLMNQAYGSPPGPGPSAFGRLARSLNRPISACHDPRASPRVHATGGESRGNRCVSWSY
jgi:hypothetical protein